MRLRLGAFAIFVLAVAATILRYSYAHFDLGVVALGVIVIGAAVVTIVPRRRVAAGWLCAAIFAGFVAMFRPNLTIATWSRYVTWMLVGVIAIGLFAVLIWLIMTDGEDQPIAEAPSRQSGRLLQPPAHESASSLRQIASN